jgi:LmbE family N-acetylglucosaminyl deacetylase
VTNPISILVVEDDEDAQTLLRHYFASRARYAPTFCTHPADAIQQMKSRHWDVLVTDFRLPTMDGLQLAEVALDLDPLLPVLLVTAYPSMDAAVRAVRTPVTDVLSKPLSRDAVYEAIDRAVATRAAARTRVLAIGAHPDDVEIGVGATLAEHVAAGDDVTVLTVSHGRSGGDPVTRAQEAQEAHEAAGRLGVRLILGDLEDTHITERGATLDLIERAIADVRPDVVYVHSLNDVHQDHRAVHAATRVAARRVMKVLCYQSPSATIDFRPTVFIAAHGGLSAKLNAIAAFETQITTRDYLAPALLEATARYWGRFSSTEFAEPFEVLRDTSEAHPVAA